jgi:hypothetical protein
VVENKPLTLTETVEFHFRCDSRGEAASEALKRRIEREMEEEKKAREVKANPFPEKIFTKQFTVTHSEKKLTEIDEFQLQSIDRHNETVEKIKQHEKQNELERKKEATFHAKPLPKTTFETKFEIQHPEREPLKAQNVNLAIDQRALKRKEFDDYIAQQQKLKEQEKLEKERKKIEEEQRIIKELRHKSIEEGGLCFKASPILTTDVFPPKHVESAPLTEPVAPNLHTASRSRVV